MTQTKHIPHAHNPHKANVDATCPKCGSDIWFKKPSGAIICAGCGAPYSPPPVHRERP